MTEGATATTYNRTSSRQLLINVGSNVALIILNMGLALWFTPYLIGVLGVAAYGVVTLATSVATYMAIIDSALNKALGRFLTIEIRQGRFAAANRTFNTALGLSLIIGLILIPIIGVIAYLSPRIFDVPATQESATQWVFLAALLSYVLMFARGVFTTSPFAVNRIDLQNAIQATGIVVRVLITIALLSLLPTPSMGAIGT
nr:polysaccharide biosynthesis protein [Promineifilum sp.]